MPAHVRSPLRETLSGRELLSRFANIAAPGDEVAGPLRGELLGAERLAERARALAQHQEVLELGSRRLRRAPLLRRLRSTARLLESAHDRLAAAVDRSVEVGTAAEWLLDNFHVVDEHVREVRTSLPPGYYRELPELARGPLAGYPRVYELALVVVSHTESRVDLGDLELFVSAYQEVRALSIGELWALPAMLRLALIESVRRMALRTVARLEEIDLADSWADRIRAAAGHGSDREDTTNPAQPPPGALREVLSQLVASPPELSAIFITRFLRQLRTGIGDFTPISWIEQWIAEDAMSPEEAATRAAHRLALTQVVMSNSITALRSIARIDWRRFIERESHLDAELRRDPDGAYVTMTFGTRDRYRHAVERIAKRTRRDETEVARRAVELAEEAAAKDGPDANGSEEARAAAALRRHVGYHLVDAGLPAFEHALGYRPRVREAAHRWVVEHGSIVFVGTVTAGTVVSLALALLLAGGAARATWLSVAAALLLALLPACDIAVNAVNQLVTALLSPRTLPKLDYSGRQGAGGIPESARTVVVVPTLIGSVDAVRDALEHLEVQYLANRAAHLRFALLTDFTDARAESVEGDAEIIAEATEGMRALNARYASDEKGGDAFLLFHRPRHWNQNERVWMGWERKRGKLAEFNRFIRGETPLEAAFSVVVGDASALRGSRYVITLDSDTVLPPGSAVALIGTIAHPLNRAIYDPALGRVVRGYGVIQPRVGVSLPSAYRSRFAAIHSGHPGVDPYTTAVSDVYQDLFGEGSFTGKGIYDVDAFEEATLGRFPENTLLSHDLIEGSYARAGLATDIELFDDYPSRYLTYTRRKHRWIRGDWQLLQWLTSSVPGPNGLEPNRLSLLSRWKLFDNLRRSLVEPAQVLFLFAGWTLLPGSPLRWTALGVLAVAAPWIVALLLAALRPPFDKSWRAYYAGVARDAVTSATQFALALAVLPHQAWISIDAIARTLWRMRVSRRHLLEWQTASHVERAAGGDRRETWQRMWPAVFLVLAMLVLTALRWSAWGPWPGTGRVATWSLVLATIPLVALWASSPLLAHELSAPVVRRERRVPDAQRAAAMRYALLHWQFFEKFVGDATHWLAPDNFQEDPAPVVAMRTSPTNIGLQLLATVSACDLGLISLSRVTERLERTFRSLERMRRHRGHFYNWYDLHDLRVLEPPYISTVDSGNLAGHLVAFVQACLTLPDTSVFDERSWLPIETGLGEAQTSLRRVSPSSAASAADAQLNAARRALASHTRALDPSATLQHAARELDAAAQSLGGASSEVTDTADAARIDDARAWIARSRALVGVWTEELAGLSPTVTPGRAGDMIASFPTLRELAGSIDPAAAARARDAGALIERLRVLADRAAAYVAEMDFRMLFDGERKLFAIGYNEDTHALDAAAYDLLASEARLASFVAIAKGDVPAEHWFRLGRTLTRAAGSTAMVSWSGSMFEYLMPALVMRSLPFTLLDQTNRSALRRQLAYGRQRDVPWGVSESAYNVRDRWLTYQYRAFGVPDLALKRGLGRDLVIAPYASALAALVIPRLALDNLARLEQLGALGPYGFRDAVDFTRPNPGSTRAIVGTYMAHHVGMSLVALTNVLGNHIWPRRFHADAQVKAVELLLYERIPRRLVLQEPQSSEAEEALPNPEFEHPSVREVDTPLTPQPHIALLGHLPYTIMVSHCGAGYSRYEKLAVTRWRADGTADDTGQFCYVKDLEAHRLWSAAHQPVCARPDWYRALLATDRVTVQRADGDIETRLEIAVAPEDAAEVRRVCVTNNAKQPREIELTSYGEIALADPDADRAHPAFSNLFVETEWHEWCSAITATRRPRTATDPQVWGVHVLAVDGDVTAAVSCETDRARFVGRGCTTRNPAALDADGPLSMTTGAVLDPIFAIRARVRLMPGQSANVTFTTLVTSSRQRAFELADRYHDPRAAQRALDLAWTAAQVELRELEITPSDAAVFQEIAGHLFYNNTALAAPATDLMTNRGGQPLLWSQGVSGDWPILLATIDSLDGLPTLRRLLAAHLYWRRRGMMVDLVVLNEKATGYMQELGDAVTTTVFSSSEAGMIDQPGGVFIRRRDLLGAEALLMLRATARVHIVCDGRPLGRIIASSLATGATPRDTERQEDEDASAPPPRSSGRSTPPALRVVRRFLGRAMAGNGYANGSANGGAMRGAAPRSDRSATSAGAALPPRDADRAALLLDNGLGGLSADGDYEIRLGDATLPPAPWSNVIANPAAGFVVSERGAGFTWAENSYFYRLTPWRNDPVSDPVGEAIYLRDEENGAIWCPTPAPVRGRGEYVVRHGAGRSTFEHDEGDIATALELSLAPHDPVKLSTLRITNQGDRTRHLTLTAYVEWTLGVLREHTQHQVRTSFDETLGAVLAWNTFDPQFADLVAFVAMSEPVVAHTCDRREFLGRNGTATAPAALRAARLTGATGAGLDPCAALQCVLELEPGETRELVIALGATVGEANARALAARHRDVDTATHAAEQTAREWRERLSVIQVRTPEPSFDAMLNRWTLYQALSCRMWARSALYQSSGAYGFRDQLQDSMAFVYAEPAIARGHILRSAARQFVEGDVQHWWHPQSGRGVRTRFSDDLVWLPYVVDHYVRVSGDTGVLDETVPFLAMRALGEHEHEVYDLPSISDETASIYEHCARALRRACTHGSHGLPLIGVGDWNDGMNRVGIEGRGESVWLAWFLIATLRAFAVHADGRGDSTSAAEWRRIADGYAAAADAAGWDGDWYRRAYFDDGTPLGSATNNECRIDAIAQSWSVISGAGTSERRALAMRSFEKHLVREDARLLMLLTPPFDTTAHDPGYIKGYLPGVRENGAQYTHAALWSVLATALEGNADRAFELFQMLNPLTHARTAAEVDVYKVEPYVVAADVYTAAGHLGRGGWTWYTGSASWMYRVALEAILGFERQGNVLWIEPCAPATWPEYAITYRVGRSVYEITVREPARVRERGSVVQLDGHALAGSDIPLVDDGGRHEVLIVPRDAPDGSS